MKLRTQVGWKVLAGVLALGVCAAVAAPRSRPARAQTVPLGSFTGRTGGPVTILPGKNLRLEMTGGVYLESATGNIAGDTVVVTMRQNDVDTAEATGHVKIVTRQPGNRVITATGSKGTLDKPAQVATLTGDVVVRVQDPDSPMTITDVARATISLDTKVIKMDPPAGGQLHFQGTMPAKAPTKK